MGLSAFVGKSSSPFRRIKDNDVPVVLGTEVIDIVEVLVERIGNACTESAFQRMTMERNAINLDRVLLFVYP